MIGIYFFYAVLALLTSVVSVKIIIILSHKFKLFDSTNERKIHEGNIPRLGGLGIFIGFFPLAIIYMRHYISTGNYGLMIAGLIIAFLCGFIDDIVRIRARYKLIIQIVSASCVAASGMLICDFRVYTFLYLDFGILAYPLTVIWIVAFMNAVNLIDGMDGLSTGIMLTANMFIIIISLMTGNSTVFVLSLILEFSILGFFIFNFTPAKIFLGDGGAYFLGFIYSVFPLMGLKKSAALTVFLIPMILMLIPITDVALVMYKRLKSNQNMFLPDKNHIHHRLMNLGFSTKEILVVLCGYTIILGIFSLIMVATNPEMTMILFGFIVLIIIFSLLVLKKVEKQVSFYKERYENNDSELSKGNLFTTLLRKIS